MRRTQRWITAMAVAMLVPAMTEATARTTRHGWTQRTTPQSEALFEVRASLGGLLDWFGTVMSALWGATRGTIVPPEGSGGNSATVDLEPARGGA